MNGSVGLYLFGLNSQLMAVIYRSCIKPSAFSFCSSCIFVIIGVLQINNRICPSNATNNVIASLPTFSRQLLDPLEVQTFPRPKFAEYFLMAFVSRTGISIFIYCKHRRDS